MQTALALSPPVEPEPVSLARILLVGAPNVGKSALFNALTGRYVVVSNYPGTTVEVTRGRALIGGRSVDVTDTPGMYSLLPVTEEERVTQGLLLAARDAVILQVVDAKNLERGLALTAQLRGLGLPLLLVLNMMDEAEERGLEIDVAGLAKRTGVPVVPIVAITGRGMDGLREQLRTITASEEAPQRSGAFPPELELAVDDIAAHLRDASPERVRTIASLLLQGDPELTRTEGERSPAAVGRAEAHRAELAARGEDPAFRVASHAHAWARTCVESTVRRTRASTRSIADRIGALLAHPITGIPALALVLYLGLYQFVGVFGAGVLVDLLESRLFGEWVNPWFDSTMQGLLPGESGWRYWVRELFAGDYGLVTLGVTYAAAIVLPIVSLFFLFFSTLEDSGYFPRLALLVDRLFRRIGLNGRAVIPVVLGFACDTMATMVTRVQETRRERVITTFLLALAVPCSAQYGVMAGVLAGQGGSAAGISGIFLAWAAIVAVVFLIAGRLASKLLPGEAPSFYMELPPVRLPRLGNVLVKTFARMKWYFAEILPLFLLASVLIWLGRLTGAFEVLVRWLVPVVGALGLPDKTAEIFLFGFFRRDFGAAGLYDLAETGALTAGQSLVAAVTLTLFMPCVAQVLVMGKERGLKTTLVIMSAVIAVAFLVGAVVNRVLPLVGMAS